MTHSVEQRHNVFELSNKAATATQTLKDRQTDTQTARHTLPVTLFISLHVCVCGGGGARAMSPFFCLITARPNQLCD